MKIHLYSDTHGYNYKPEVKADIIVNAGDGLNEHQDRLEQCEGNHDFYGTDIEGYSSKYYQNQSWYGGGKVKFFCCPLWTNFWGQSLEDDFVGSNRHVFDTCLNDFHCIKGMTPEKMAELFNTDFKFLKYNVEKYSDKDNSIVIATHFAPSKKSIHPKYKGNMLNPYFVNDLDEFILANPQIKLWCHGHTHSSLDYMIGETRVVCNPLGYQESDGSFENPEFNKDLIIEI
jgi:predicted phosphodiesterase